MTETRWRKASFSGNQANCIELASTLDRVRDSKSPQKVLSASALRALVHAPAPPLNNGAPGAHTPPQCGVRVNPHNTLRRATVMGILRNSTTTGERHARAGFRRGGQRYVHLHAL